MSDHQSEDTTENAQGSNVVEKEDACLDESILFEGVPDHGLLVFNCPLRTLGYIDRVSASKGRGVKLIVTHDPTPRRCLVIGNGDKASQHVRQLVGKVAAYYVSRNYLGKQT